MAEKREDDTDVLSFEDAYDFTDWLDAGELTEEEDDDDEA